MSGGAPQTSEYEINLNALPLIGSIRFVKRHKPGCSSPHYRVIPVRDNHVGDHKVLVWKRASQIVDALDSLSPGLRRTNCRPQQNEQHESNRKGGDPATSVFLHTLIDTDAVNSVQNILVSHGSCTA